MIRSNRRIVFTAPQSVEVQHEEVSTDGLGPDELLVESLYSVVSAGTELACLSGREAWFSFPRVPGYATTGRIVALGDAVTGLREGEVVLHYGGHQAYNRRTRGDLLLPVPDGIGGEVAAMTRLATVALTSIRVSSIEAGDFVAVAGLGPVGNLAAQLAQIQAWWLQQTGKLQMHKLITHVVRPDDAAAAYEDLRSRKDEYLGVVFDWSSA